MPVPSPNSQAADAGKPLSSTRLTFGLFEMDAQSGEIWKAGFRVKLQSQPFKILAALVERAGQVVTRDELQQRLWGRDTVVDFDHSLGTAINKIREALGDSAENPRFIETLSRRGYRFIAPVGTVEAPAAVAVAAMPREPVPSREETPVAAEAIGSPARQLKRSALKALATQQGARMRRVRTPAAAALAAATLLIAGYLVGSARQPVLPAHMTQITHSGHLATSVDSMEDLAVLATDGYHLYASTLESGHSVVSAISTTGGVAEPISFPSEIAGPTLGDISPDGTRLLLRDHLSPVSEQPLWVVPVQGGSASRVGNVLAHDATFMPDGEGILYATGNDLYVERLSGQPPTHFATLPGRAFWLRWQPNGRLLRFTVLDPLTHAVSLWQLTPQNRTPQKILNGFNQPGAECCGVWTADGRRFVFQSTRNGRSDLWSLAGTATSAPQQLTDGPLQFESPVAARTGSRIYFLGADARSELQMVNAAGALVPVRGFLSSAVRVDYSRDGRWVAWTDTAGQLWRAHTDGSEMLLLTPRDLYAFLARWSPDGSRLAIMGRKPGEAWHLYLASADGGDLQPLLRESRNAADPSWSPDGQSLVFGRVNDEMGKENAARTLMLLHLGSGQLEPVPGSDGLFSPRWSPDGRYIAALSLDQRQVRLYTVATHAWTTLPVASGADPVWSSDSRSLFLHGSLDPAQPIVRVTVPGLAVEPVVRLAEARGDDAVDYVFGGLTPENRPLVRARVFTANIYSLDLR